VELAEEASMQQRKLNRRDFLRVSAATATGLLVAACAPSTPMVVEKEVIKEVPVEKQVTVEKEVPVEVQKEVTKEVPVEVEKVVVQTVEVVKEQPVLPQATVRWMDFGGTRWGPYHEWVVEQFKDVEPNITLNYEPNPSGWYEKLMAQMVAGDAPDIFFGWGYYFGAFHSKGQILDLQPFVDQDFDQATVDDFVTQQWDGLLAFGTNMRMAMPKYINWFPWFYNKQLFEENDIDPIDLEWTYDDADEAIRKLTKVDADGKHLSWGGNFNYCLTAWDPLPPLLHRWGGNKVDPTDNTNCMLDEPPAQEALEWYRARLWDEDPNILVQSMQSEGFEMGIFQLGMVGISEDGINNVVSRAEQITDKFPWDIAPPAMGPARRAAYLVTDARCIWSETKVPDASWAVLKYLAEPEALRVMTTMTKQLGVRDSVFDLWPRVLRTTYPVLENMDLEMVHEGIYDLQYSTMDEMFKNEAEARAIGIPAMEKVFVVGDAPVSTIADACAEIEAVQ
jgi:ABC-type glycerol-3-phosphate transport system substrate-binding protein